MKNQPHVAWHAVDHILILVMSCGAIDNEALLNQDYYNMYLRRNSESILSSYNRGKFRIEFCFWKNIQTELLISIKLNTYICMNENAALSR